MKTAYLVCGAPSSGTRLATRLLIDQGIFGDPVQEQRIDRYVKEGFGQCPHERFVLRRTAPHGSNWPHIDKIIASIRSAGYRVIMLVTVRDWYSIAMSGSNHRYLYMRNYEQAIATVPKSYRMIFKAMPNDIEYHFVVYENILLYPRQYPAWILEQIGVEKVNDIEPMINGNEKYYA